MQGRPRLEAFVRERYELQAGLSLQRRLLRWDVFRWFGWSAGVVLGIALLLWGGALNTGVYLFVLAGVPAGGLLWLRGSRRVRALRAGLRGERVGARLLAPLAKEGYIVLHDVTLTAGDRTAQVDHLVIGPNGLFIIETKAWAGAVSGDFSSADWTHDGQTVANPVKQSQRQAFVIRGWLNERAQLFDDPLVAGYTWVQPIVCFVHPGVSLHLRGTGSATAKVVTGHNLAETIRSFRARVELSPAERERIAAAVLGA